MKKKIGLIVGSVRNESYSQKTAAVMQEQLNEHYDVMNIKIDDLPIYNQDVDEMNTPVEYTRFRSELKQLDGVIFVTPEYNRAIPALLKNALDIGSRPYGENGWDGLPALVISVSMGALGGYGASQNLREIASVLNIRLMATPEVYLSNVQNYFNADGTINNKDTENFLADVSKAYAEWLELLS